MPHAEKDGSVLINGDMSTTTTTTNGAPLTNGEKPSSKVLSHLQSYPLISDTLTLFTHNPYGAKSLTLLQKARSTFISPLQPYLSTPYSYISPYLARADDIGDSSLSRLDSNFPIVKEETSTLKEKAVGVVGRYVPLEKLEQGKGYLERTWGEEYERTGGEEGWGKRVKVLVSTELRVGIEGFGVLRQWFEGGRERVGKKVGEVRQ